MVSGKPWTAMSQPERHRSRQEHDYWFSLPDECTFLAWIRSALAPMTGGVVLVQFATHLSPRWLLASTIWR